MKVLPMLAAKILQIGQCQLQTAVLGGSQQQLGVTDASAVDDFRQSVYHISLSYNIFKLHLLWVLTCKYTNKI